MSFLNLSAPEQFFPLVMILIFGPNDSTRGSVKAGRCISSFRHKVKSKSRRFYSKAPPRGGCKYNCGGSSEEIFSEQIYKDRKEQWPAQLSNSRVQDRALVQVQILGKSRAKTGCSPGFFFKIFGNSRFSPGLGQSSIDRLWSPKLSLGNDPGIEQFRSWVSPDLDQERSSLMRKVWSWG